MVCFVDKKHAFSLFAEDKQRIMLGEQKRLCSKYDREIVAYHNIISSLNINLSGINELEDIPFLPARLFKSVSFRRKAETHVLQLQSSGTNGEKSKINLDQSDIKIQRKVLYDIAQSFIGSYRRPMIVLEKVEHGHVLSAKSAGVLGFMLFASKVCVLSEQDADVQIQNFINEYGDDVLIYGTTVDVYNKLVFGKSPGIAPLPHATLIVSGGWKGSAVTRTQEELCFQLERIWGITRVYDYYGMVEQTGSVFFRCEKGHYHCSDYSDIIIRDPVSFQPVPYGVSGLIQCLTTIDMSYPNNSVLTEDVGVIIGEDDCQCGRCGKYFKIFGRLKNAPVKGCAYE